MASLVIDFIGSMHAKMNCIKKENELLYLTVWLFHMLLKGLIWKLEQSNISDYPYSCFDKVCPKTVQKRKRQCRLVLWKRGYYESIAVLRCCPHSYLFPKMFTFDWRVLREIQFTQDSECAQKTCCRHISSNRFDTSLPFWHIAACLHCSLCWTAYSFTSHLVSIIVKD